MKERRRDNRFGIPEDFRDYFEMSLLAPGEVVNLRLLDFSRHGLRLGSPQMLLPGSIIQCSLSAPRLLTAKSISLTLCVKHCSPLNDHFIAGLEVQEVSCEIWFRVFKNIHDFVVDRTGQVY